MKILIYKIVLILILSILFNSNLSAKYYLVNVEIHNEVEKKLLLDSGLEIVRKYGNNFELIVDENEFDKYVFPNFVNKIIIEDIEKFNEIQLNAKSVNNYFLNNEYFRFGSMNGHFRLNEIYSEFDRMIDIYPDYIKKDTIGLSCEQRPLIVYTFGYKNTNSPQIFLNSLIHSREPGTVFTMIYYFWQLFEKFDKKDPMTEFILNNRQIFVFPVVNPDGVAFNEFYYPNGGGMWRKNRRENSYDNYGVDLNRNFGPLEAWDSKNNGSSTDPISSIYRGEEPFSEPETDAIRKFVEKENIKIALNLHTYGNVAFYPLSHLSKETKDSLWYRGFLEENFRQSRYTFGLDSDVLYPTRGSADDFFYIGNEKFKSIRSMTVEIGSAKYLFWPTANQTLEYAKINSTLINNIILSAGQNICISNKDVVKVDGKYYVKFIFQNIGLEDIENIEINVNSLGNGIEITDQFTIIKNLKQSNEIEKYFEFIPKDIKNGDFVEIEITCNFEYEKKFLLSLQVYDYEEISLLENSQLSKWKLEKDWNFDNLNGKNILSSNTGNLYGPSMNSFATYNFPTLAGKINSYTLNFNHTYSFENEYDMGLIWTGKDTLSHNPNFGEFLSSASNIEGSAQIGDLYGFTGVQKYFNEQLLYLNKLGDYINTFAFNLKTDKSNFKTGWRISDLKLRIFKDIDVSINSKNIDESNIILNYDFINQQLIVKSINLTGIFSLKLYSLSGNSIACYKFNVSDNIHSINLSNLSTGVYIIIGNIANKEFSQTLLIIN